MKHSEDFKLSARLLKEKRIYFNELCNIANNNQIHGIINKLSQYNLNHYIYGQNYNVSLYSTSHRTLAFLNAKEYFSRLAKFIASNKVEHDFGFIIKKYNNTYILIIITMFILTAVVEALVYHFGNF